METASLAQTKGNIVSSTLTLTDCDLFKVEK